MNIFKYFSKKERKRRRVLRYKTVITPGLLWLSNGDMDKFNKDMQEMMDKWSIYV
jgi:hypothetical protein